MESKEFGLVAAQQLFGVDDLHYGYWEEGQSPTIESFPQAQKRATEFLLEHIHRLMVDHPEGRILDSGCGIGATLQTLLENNYRADGLVPSHWMAQKARQRLTPFNATQPEVFCCPLEDLRADAIKQPYRLVLFSESYQYIKLDPGFDTLDAVLENDGLALIFDFFRKDGVEGKSTLGGGHSLARFKETAERREYQIVTDLDLTPRMSPNLRLIHEILRDRVIPFGSTLDAFLNNRYRLAYGALRVLFNKKLKKLSEKYSERRNEADFIKYKTYRLFVLRRTQVSSS